MDPETLPLPFPGALGRWVDADLVDENTKSFGFYFCYECNRRWKSAHSRVEFYQQCQKCETEVYPDFMWENDISVKREKKKPVIEDNEVPHDSTRCQACAVGKCIGKPVYEYPTNSYTTKNSYPTRANVVDYIPEIQQSKPNNERRDTKIYNDPYTNNVNNESSSICILL